MLPNNFLEFLMDIMLFSISQQIWFFRVKWGNRWQSGHPCPAPEVSDSVTPLKSEEPLLSLPAVRIGDILARIWILNSVCTLVWIDPKEVIQWLGMGKSLFWL